MAQTPEAVRTNPRLRRVLGGALSVLAVVSLVLSIVGVYWIWSVRATTIHSVDYSLALVWEMLDSGDHALVDADDQLVAASDALIAAENMARNVAGMMGATRDSLKTSATIVGTELPGSIRATQTAIDNAQGSARLIDNVLGTLAAIPFLGIDYRPEVPLSDQLANMSHSLDRLPGLTSDLSKQIDVTATELGDAQTETVSLAASLQKSRSGLAESRVSVAEVRADVSRAKSMVASAREQVPTAISLIAAGLTFVLAWLTLVQIASLILGLEWLLGDDPLRRL